MRTAMQEVKAADNDSGSTHSITLSVPASLAPLTLAFVIQIKPPPVVTSGSTVSGAPASGSPASGSPASSTPASGAIATGTTATGTTIARPRFVTPLRGRHFSALIGCGAGNNLREGATLLHPPASSPQAAAGQRGQPAQPPPGQSVNFAVRCRGAERVCLVLLRPKAGPASPAGAPVSLQQQLVREWGMMEIVLDPVLNRSGELWHIEGPPSLLLLPPLPLQLPPPPLLHTPAAGWIQAHVLAAFAPPASAQPLISAFALVCLLSLCATCLLLLWLQWRGCVTLRGCASAGGWREMSLGSLDAGCSQVRDSCTADGTAVGTANSTAACVAASKQCPKRPDCCHQLAA
jgi:hypothetical protein